METKHVTYQSNLLRLFKVITAAYTTIIPYDYVKVSHSGDDDDTTADGHDGLYCGDVY